MILSGRMRSSEEVKVECISSQREEDSLNRIIYMEIIWLEFRLGLEVIPLSGNQYWLNELIEGNEFQIE